MVPAAILLMLAAGLFAAQLWMIAFDGAAPGDAIWVDTRAATIGDTIARLLVALGSLAVLLVLRRKILAGMARAG